MKTVLIACRLLWKRKFASLTLILQIVFSVTSLAQLFVFIVDHTDNVRAVNELPTENAVAVSTYDYCSPEQVEQQIEASPLVDSIGKAYLGGLLFNDISCNIAVYNAAVIERYTPKLQQGSWFSDAAGANGQEAAEAVVSSDTGLRPGDTASILLPSHKKLRIVVTGVLPTPTQYFFPSGTASPEYFAANIVISQNSVFILREADVADLTGLDEPATLLVFFKPEATQTDRDGLIAAWSRYSEATPMPSLLTVYNQNMRDLIGLGSLSFFVFLAAAATGVLGNNVIQSMRNRKLFTVYYLLGMDWKKGVLAEIIRVVVLLTVTMALCVVAGRYGLLMLDWMTPQRAVLFYGVVFLYIVCMFAAVGARFLVKLMREDISTSLKELHQGE